jgi:ribosomal protein L11 methyltransferase
VPKLDYTRGVPFAVIIIDTEEAGAEIVSAHLSQRGVALELRDADTLERAAEGRVELRVYVPPERLSEELDELGRLLAELTTHCPSVRGFRLASTVLEDESWRDAWKRFFRAQRVGRFLVRPSWDQPPPAAHECVIDLDPGRAFGTGAHASTRLCLTAVEEAAERGATPRRVLDAGCGSGILTIAALKVWPAATALALDLDPEAVATARENVERNGLGNRVTFERVEVAAVAGVFDLVLANIQREVLEQVVPGLTAAVGPSGWLVLSGLLTGEEGFVWERYVAAGLLFERTLTDGEWTAVVLRRG